MKPPTIAYLSNIHFECGASAMLPTLLESLGAVRPLIVTDRGILGAGLIDQLPLKKPILFDRVDANPTELNVMEGVACYRDHDCDSVVAIGGGSPIDCAKCVALMTTHSPPLSDYAFIRGGMTNITADKPPLIAIPTTAGTGSEVGRAALISFEDGTKLGLLSPFLIPNAVICDPHLTVGLPPMFTAATAMDAVSHCVETFCSPRFNPVADSIALDGFQRAVTNVRQAVAHGNDLQVRSEMMMAALQGGLTFQKGLGAIHSLSHPLGALKHKRLHHGTLNAIFLPHVLRYNLPLCSNRLSSLAQSIDLADCNELPDFFFELSSELGLPTKLREMDIEHADLEPLAERAMSDHCSATNPRPVTIEAYRQLYQDAY